MSESVNISVIALDSTAVLHSDTTSVIAGKIMSDIAGFLWGPPLVVLLLGGGLFFTAYCRFTPFRYFRHALEILTGKFDKEDDPGQISHFEALSSALASTVGMGNITGVAIAIHTGGPGAIFWMWVTAIIGMSTKFFTCTLAVLYRGRDDNGDIQGGPMYFIEQGLGKRFKPLAVFFSFAGMFASFTFLQANQLVEIIRKFVYGPEGFFIKTLKDSYNSLLGDAITGTIIALIVALVIFGGLHRIAKVASRLVPIMVGLYLFAALIILILNFSLIPKIFANIFFDAFTGDAVAGGALGTMIITGVRRGLFSNEAGAGTEALAHGAAKTSEPVREGLVAMLGPFIDTIVVCTTTALVILISGLYKEHSNVTLTLMAFEQELGIFGRLLLFVAVITFSLSTMFGYSYYGRKCASYLYGSRIKQYYNYIYVLVIVIASVSTIKIVIDFVDSCYALMVIPTMIGTILLSPKVIIASKEYFSKVDL